MPRISEPTVAEHRAVQHRAVLDAAERLIVAGEGQMPTITDVAAEVGLARSSVYLYATSRTDLLIQLLIMSIDAWITELSDLMADVGDDPGDRLAVYADATGYAPGSAWVMTSDLPFPDYTVAAITTPTTELTSSDLFPLAVTIRNVGNLATPTGLRVPLAIHASRNSVTSTNTLLLESSIAVTADQPLAPGQDITVTLDVPLGGLGVADDWRFVAVVNHTNALRELSRHNNQLFSGAFRTAHHIWRCV